MSLVSVPGCGISYWLRPTKLFRNNSNHHIRSRGEEQAEKEKHPDKKARRWVVEVCHSWLNRFRKILVRFEKKRTHHLGLLAIACAYIVFKRAEIF